MEGAKPEGASNRSIAYPLKSSRLWREKINEKDRHPGFSFLFSGWLWNNKKSCLNDEYPRFTHLDCGSDTYENDYSDDGTITNISPIPGRFHF